MSRFLSAVIIIAALVVGLGIYMKWFNVSVDKEKMQADEKSAAEKAKALELKAKEELTPAPK